MTHKSHNKSETKCFMHRNENERNRKTQVWTLFFDITSIYAGFVHKQPMRQWKFYFQVNLQIKLKKQRERIISIWKLNSIRFVVIYLCKAIDWSRSRFGKIFWVLIKFCALWKNRFRKCLVPTEKKVLQMIIFSNIIL